VWNLHRESSFVHEAGNALLSGGAGLAQDPGGHAAVVLDDGGLKGVYQDSVHMLGQPHQLCLVDEEPLLSVFDAVDVGSEGLEVHADAGAQPAEEQAAGTEDSPELRYHGEEVGFVACKVEDGAADDYVGEVVGEVQLFDWAYAEVACWQCRGKLGGQRPYVGDGLGARVDSVDLGSFAEKMDEVSAVAAAGVEDAHAGCDVAAQDLVEDVDVDLAELLLQVHCCFSFHKAPHVSTLAVL
jgi:hypothetical protein